MSVLGSVSYKFESDVTSLLKSSKEAEAAFARADKSASKFGKSLEGVEKKTGLFGKGIKMVLGTAAAGGLALFAKHMLSGTKAGEQFGKAVDKALPRLKSFQGYVAGSVKPLTDWLGKTKAGTVALGGLGKALDVGKKAFSGMDRAAGVAAAGVKKAAAGGVGAFTSWGKASVIAAAGTAAMGASATKAVGGVTKFGGSLKGAWKGANEVFEAVEKVELGIVGLMGNFGKAAVKTGHFSSIVALLGAGLSFLPGPLGAVGAGVALLSGGIAGLIFGLGAAAAGVGALASAIGDRLLYSTREWVASFAEAEVVVLGFNTAIQAYNEHTKGAEIHTRALDNWITRLSASIGIGRNELRQVTLRVLELSRVTGLSEEQVKLMTERAIDLSKAMHRDLWDGVWAVIEAMRGFPIMATGFGLALDNAALKTSEFTRATKKNFDALDEHEQAQIVFQEMMKQSSWAAGFASKMVGETLVGAEVKAQQATEQLNQLLGEGSSKVWKPWSKAVADVKMQLVNFAPGLIKLRGTLQAFTGVAFKVLGVFISWPGKILLALAAMTALKVASPLLVSVLSKVALKTGTATVAFASLRAAIWWMASTGIKGLWQALGTLVGMLGVATKALWKFTVAHTLATLGISALLAAVGYLVAKYIIFRKSSEELREEAELLHQSTEQQIKDLKALKSQLEETHKTERERREIIVQALKDFPELAENIDLEKESREENIKVLEEEIKKREKLAKAVKEQLIEEATKDLEKKRKAYEESDKELEKAVELTEFLSVSNKELTGTYDDLQIAQLKLIGFYRGKDITKAAAAQQAANEEYKKAQAHLDQLLGKHKEVVKVLEEGQGYKLVQVNLSDQERQALESYLDAVRDVSAETHRLTQDRIKLIDESMAAEKDRALSLQDQLREIGMQSLEFEREVKDKRLDIVSAYQSGVITQATKANKQQVNSFKLTAGSFFNQLTALETRNLEVQRRSLDDISEMSKKATDETLASFAKQVAGVGKVYSNLADPLGEHVSATAKAVDEMAGYYGDFRGQVQRVYEHISGYQDSFLDVLKRTGPTTDATVLSMVKSLGKIEESYGRQIKSVQDLMAAVEKQTGSYLSEAEKQIQIDDLRLKKAQDHLAVLTRHYELLRGQQAALTQQIRNDFAKLNQLTQDFLSRQQEMEDVLIEARRKAGQVTVDDRTRWYQKFNDLEIRYREGQQLTAEERKKLDQDLIRSAQSMVGEITDAHGNVLMTEQETARRVVVFMQKVWEDEKKASNDAKQAVEADMAKRSAALQDVGEKVEVVAAQIKATQKVAEDLADSIAQSQLGFNSATIGNALSSLAKIREELDKIQQKHFGVSVLVDPKDEAKTAIVELRKFIEKLLSDKPFAVRIQVDTTGVKKGLQDALAAMPTTPTTEKPAAAVPAKPWLGDVRRRAGGPVGRIPGFGGGDSVPLQAEPGQFVLRKEAVAKYGTSFLDRVAQVPSVGGGRPRVPVLVEPGEYMVPPGAVQTFGAGLFEQLNARKLQQGGQVVRAPGIEFGTVKEALGPIGERAEMPALSMLLLKLIKLKKRVSPAAWAGTGISSALIEDAKRRYGDDWEKAIERDVVSGGGPAAALWRLAKAHPNLVKALQLALPFQKGGVTAKAPRRTVLAAYKKQAKDPRLERMLSTLKKLGIDISYERATKILGRAAGYVDTFKMLRMVIRAAKTTTKMPGTGAVSLLSQVYGGEPMASGLYEALTSKKLGADLTEEQKRLIGQLTGSKLQQGGQVVQGLTYRQYLDRYGVKDPDDPRHYYDYYGAFAEGFVPTRWMDLPQKDREEDLDQIKKGMRPPISPNDYMWTDRYKLRGHPIPPEDGKWWTKWERKQQGGSLGLRAQRGEIQPKLVFPREEPGDRRSAGFGRIYARRGASAGSSVNDETRVKLAIALASARPSLQARRDFESAGGFITEEEYAKVTSDMKKANAINRRFHLPASYYPDKLRAYIFNDKTLSLGQAMGSGRIFGQNLKAAASFLQEIDKTAGRPDMFQVIRNFSRSYPRVDPNLYIPAQTFSRTAGAPGPGRTRSRELIPGISARQLLPFADGGLIPSNLSWLSMHKSLPLPMIPSTSAPAEKLTPGRKDTLEVLFKIGDEAYPVKVEGKENINMMRQLSKEMSRQRLVRGAV